MRSVMGNIVPVVRGLYPRKRRKERGTVGREGYQVGICGGTRRTRAQGPARPRTVDSAACGAGRVRRGLGLIRWPVMHDRRNAAGRAADRTPAAQCPARPARKNLYIADPCARADRASASSPERHPRATLVFRAVLPLGILLLYVASIGSFSRSPSLNAAQNVFKLLPERNGHIRRTFRTSNQMENRDECHREIRVSLSPNLRFISLIKSSDIKNGLIL